MKHSTLIRLLAVLVSVCLLLSAAPPPAVRAAGADELQIGDYIALGTYRDENMSFPLVWQMIHREGDRALLYGAQIRPHHAGLRSYGAALRLLLLADL